jgi:hypothetical protein
MARNQMFQGVKNKAFESLNYVLIIDSHMLVNCLFAEKNYYNVANSLLGCIFAITF